MVVDSPLHGRLLAIEDFTLTSRVSALLATPRVSTSLHGGATARFSVSLVALPLGLVLHLWRDRGLVLHSWRYR